ncbi:MAG: prolyl oligopeptidase family serine peptidase [Rhodopirellula sp.]|nr:prolyl oligopeptidase family serine peptidase [Rhodopirellula sp.]
MNSIAFRLATLVGLILAATHLRAAENDCQKNSPAVEPGSQQPCELNRQVRYTLDYLLYLPKGYDQQDCWPLVLFLHGAGERGDDLELVKKHGPPMLAERGKDFPFILVSPQCPKGRWWQAGELSALLDEITEKYRVDNDRVYVTGLSMGGFGTWLLAASAPDRFAALAPICGGGEVYWAKDLAHVPVWAFHGGKDSVVPPERSEKMVAAVHKHGGTAKLTVYPDAAHDSWTETYATPEFYDWLLEQRRTKPTKE